jgi:hypothetical protein
MKISLNQKIIIGIVALVPCFFGISCIYLHPLLYNTPLATGPYAIGTTHLYWIDDSRIDKRFPSGKREIRIEFFYPSIRENEDLLFPYQPEKINALKIIKSEYFSLPSFIWRCLLDGIYSHANPEAYFNTKEPLYPVIIFLPGIGGDNFYNTYLEELASHGYIVVALEPPFDTSVTVLSNGTFVGLDNSLIYAAKHGLRDEIYAYRTKAHKNWNEDIDFVLKKLKKLNNDSSSQFYKKTLDEKYEIAITQLQKHLESSALTPQDRSDLINKLVSYFAPLSTKKSEIFLKNKQAQVIYGAVIKSYNELKSAQNHEKSGDKAKKFAEQAIGKIVLYRKPNNQKARLKK